MRANLLRFASIALLIVAGWAFGPSGSVGQPAKERERGKPGAPIAPVDGVKANPAEETLVRPGADPVLPGMPEAIAALIRDGQFAEATRRLKALSEKDGKAGSALDPRMIGWQIEKLRRYGEDFDTTRPELLTSLGKRIRDFQEAELDKWINDGLVDRIRIDGQERFAGATISNLCFLSPEIRARKIGDTDHNLEQYVIKMVKRLNFLRSETNTMYAPKRFRIATGVNVKTPPDRVGQAIRAWVPLVREYPFIKDIAILKTTPEPKHVAPPDAPQRTVYFEQTATADSPSSFGVVYEYTAFARVNKIEDHKVEALNPDNPMVRDWTQEETHVRFTPEMRALYQEIVGADRNPARVARKIYIWISNNIRYSYAREYSTLDDLGLYTAARRTGDCGQEALLFITLCRMGGIPARWQSGWTCYPDWSGMHDWTEIYLNPYGWVPVDPYMGIWATRYMETLTTEQKIEVRDFYFGSMDANRLPMNAAHSAKFDPPKKGFRSDDVDNQRGEMEWADGTNLYFGEYKRSMKIVEVPIETKPAAKEMKPATKEMKPAAKPAGAVK